MVGQDFSLTDYGSASAKYHVIRHRAATHFFKSSYQIKNRISTAGSKIKPPAASYAALTAIFNPPTFSQSSPQQIGITLLRRTVFMYKKR